MVLPAMEPYYTQDGNGRYQRLFKEIRKRSGVDFKIEYYPSARSILMFDQNKKACYPAARKLAFGFLGYDVIDAGIAINNFRIVIATLKSDPLIATVDSLRNRRIATLLGEALRVYGISLSKITVHYVSSHEQSLKLLKSGRVQAIVGSAIDLMP